jgi:hypothetical protein
MSRFRSMLNQSPAIVISVVALAFSLGGGAGYAASTTSSHPAAAAKTTWHALSLRNGWKSAASRFHTGGPAFTVIDKVVYLTGVAYQPANSANPPAVVAVLPKAERPKHSLWFSIYDYAAAGNANLEIATNGDVEVIGGTDSAFFTSFAGVSYPLGS